MEAKDIMGLKSYMHRFITENQKTFVPATYIEEILSIDFKDCDDDYGAIGQHYVVKLILRVPDFTLTSGSSYKVIESTCLVNVKQFNHFLEKHRAVIWL